MSGPNVIVLPTDASDQPVFNAGDVGVSIQLPAGQAQNLTGATCTIAIVSPAGYRHVIPNSSITVSSDGTSCAFPTAAMDFPVAGTYTLQLTASFNTGAQIIKMDEVQLVVGPSL